jgi:hypothetical protein
VNQLAGQLHTDPSFLMSAMAFESAESFSSSVTNKKSHAVGLIQFLPKTAKALGTSTTALSLMTPEEQLTYVKDYFVPYAGRLNTLADVYAAILYPKAVGKSGDFVLFNKKTMPTTYAQNKPLDANHDGKITKDEATAKVANELTKGSGDGLCYMTPTASTARLVVGTNQLSFTATQGGANPAPQSLVIANFGDVGSTLNFQAIGSDIVSVQSPRNQLGSGDLTVATVSVDTAGLAAGTYTKSVEVYDSSAENSPQFVTITITITGSNPTSGLKYAGRFTGSVTNSSADDSDPGEPFTDSWGGPATVTVTPRSGGGYTLTLSGNLTTSSPHGEDFSANPNGSITVSNLGSVSFSFPMGDGNCQVTGTITAAAFSGTWRFVQSNSNDLSDSGSGSFFLSAVATA